MIQTSSSKALMINPDSKEAPDLGLPYRCRPSLLFTNSSPISEGRARAISEGGMLHPYRHN